MKIPQNKPKSDKCPNCNGKGKRGDLICSSCGGTGKICEDCKI